MHPENISKLKAEKIQLETTLLQMMYDKGDYKRQNQRVYPSIFSFRKKWMKNILQLIIYTHSEEKDLIWQFKTTCLLSCIKF
jgi:hypothetical protein